MGSDLGGVMCACWCLRDVHERWNDTAYCGRCGRKACPRYRPARVRWYQVWRPRLALGPLTASDLELLSARPEEIS